MSPLFRKSPEKLARQAAARAEIKRLRAVNVDDLAVQLLPGLGPDGVAPGYGLYPQQLCNYLLQDFPDAKQLDVLDLLAAVRRALDRLEDVGLLSSISHQRTPVWRITPLGEAALADGTVAQRLGRAA